MCVCVCIWREREREKAQRALHPSPPVQSCVHFYLHDRRILVDIVESDRSESLFELEAKEPAVEVDRGAGPDASADILEFQGSVDVELTKQVEIDAAVRGSKAEKKDRAYGQGRGKS